MRPLALTLLLCAACAPRGGGHAALGGGSHQSEAVTYLCPGSTTLAGMDVSDYDSVNWPVAATDGGIAWAIARISDGLDYPDTQFAYNWAGMLDAGVIRGAYQFYESTQDPTMQANMVVAAVGKLGPNDLPVAFDMESGDPPTSDIQTWMGIVEAGTGKVPMIYTGWGFWNGLGYGTTFSNLALWVANYEVTCPCVPDGWNDYVMWQWTGNGTVSGNTSTGNSDLDIFNGTRAQLLTFAQGSASTCGASAATCASDGDCCFGLTCQSGACAAPTCTALWDACTEASQCCAGMTCLTWTPSGGTAGSYCCDGVGATCSDSRDCCGGSLCDNGTCACVPQSTYCQNDVDCCSGLSCQSGECQPTSASASSTSSGSSSAASTASSTSSTGSSSGASGTTTSSGAIAGATSSGAAVSAGATTSGGSTGAAATTAAATSSASSGSSSTSATAAGSTQGAGAGTTGGTSPVPDAGGHTGAKSGGCAAAPSDLSIEAMLALMLSVTRRRRRP